MYYETPPPPNGEFSTPEKALFACFPKSQNQYKGESSILTNYS